MQNIHYRDLILLDHLADYGMSEMIGLMRLHVQEVTRFTSMITLKLKLTETQACQFEKDCNDYSLDSQLLLETNETCFRFTAIGLFIIKICAKIHDIGKPFFRNIYSQERLLNQREFKQQKLHANLSRIIVKSWVLDDENNFDNPKLIQFVADMAASHQEKYDGSGYPDGKSGNEIGLIGRLLSITDAISAMMNPRPYTKPLSLLKCIERMKESAGTHFDPDLLKTVIKNLQTEKFSENKFTGHWTDKDKLSDDYLGFIQLINLDKIPLCRGDTKNISKIRESIKEALDRN